MDMQDFNKSIIDEFRANNGVVGGQFAGAPLLLLTTTGAKTGLSRVNPLAFLADKNRHVIIASYAGGPTNPPWYHNLIANPEVYVEVGSDSFRAKAELASEPERSELYKKIADAMPAFAEYQTKTTRVIPVIALIRTD
jgi:deazaflavin-dependent oxidoreductase (nitroreductase family)